jgi:hypothetical protein
VSFNEINFIELKTFMNLNKLKSLDLNYNKLISIENDLFFGLTNLNDLYFLSQNEMTFHNQSFHHLQNISSIVLNESLISNYKCLFMHNLQRDIQRTISNKYIFYKSINLITLGFKFNDSLDSKCDLVFHLFQFNIHFNLKTDYDNDLFYDSCQKILIKRENTFTHNKRKCFVNIEFIDKENEAFVDSLHPILKVFHNWIYLLSMVILLSFLLPIFYMIIRYEFLANFLTFHFRVLSNNNQGTLKEIEKKLTKSRDNLKKALVKKETIERNHQRVKQVIQKNEVDIQILEEEKFKILEMNKSFTVKSHL